MNSCHSVSARPERLRSALSERLRSALSERLRSARPVRSRSARPMRPRSARPMRPRAGFTLLELLIVMSLVAILAGVMVPATGSIMRSQGRRATIDELELLSGAVQEFYRDTLQFPASPLDLLGSATPGWSGPYLRGTVDDPWSGQSGYMVDGFGNPYTFAVSGLELTVTSDGPDRTNGSADDLELVVNVTPVLRELTLDELEIINTAIGHYNSIYLSTSPLPGNYAAALSMLESNGFLPIGAGYDRDAWGDAYTGNPPGVSPMMQAVSSHVGG